MTDIDTRLERIVSGGQTGVDRAGLDAALEAGLPIGGWCPKGRRSEDGRIPARYPLTETDARSYAVRTEWNVRDSDGTLVLAMGEVSSGTKLTINFAKKADKPLQVVMLRPVKQPGLFDNQNSLTEQTDLVVEWIRNNRIRTLNVAGPRGSSHPDVYEESRQFMTVVFQAIACRSTDSR